MADLIDPTQTGNYPVILSDRLLNKETNEIFTGIRYNHKPSFPTESTRARLKPAAGGKPNSFDLNFIGSDGRTEYAYEGARTVGDGRYVLYFDPGREAFVLDRMDSIFHMNLTRTPTNTDPESLSRKYPHLDDDAAAAAAASAGTRMNKDDGAGSTTSSSGGGTRADKSKPKVTRAKSPLVAPTRKKEPAATARKTEKKTAAKNSIHLELPQTDEATTSKAKPKAKPRQPEEKKKKKEKVDDDEDEEDEEDADDDLLLVEYPGGAPKSQSRDFSPAFPSVRRFDEFMDQRESEADDADGESLGDPDTDFKLPSPVNNGNGRQDDEDDDEDGADPMDVDEGEKHQQHLQQYHVDDNDDADAGVGAGSPNLEDDLEKDLEEAFEAVANSHHGTPADGDESEISEED
ncbi:hypothetical protein ACRE_059440 [Hapsidospora chrysogenum ATCC 11550]|uniref:Transcription elongation factor Eaf N-terminal domain-containing protein n=1 Tax=Hapsidospora chrysogenum (strain ATCC 11550 / CBS 779.69 / DSM 880 / IAM 14645 / JCM 23072 / IMI 49137) TaxID=857340 RepID=A0A086T1U3_HAPC1|nr:hypothetical protein ACRE_059440 [Hapsidospora chrysogenum ATCC 11550]